MDDHEKTRLVAEAIKQSVGSDVHQLSQSLSTIAERVNLATARLAQHEHSTRIAFRVMQWVGTPLMCLFAWVLIRGQTSIDDALRSQHATSLKLEAILQQMEADRKLAQTQHQALTTRVERIEQTQRR